MGIKSSPPVSKTEVHSSAHEVRNPRNETLEFLATNPREGAAEQFIRNRIASVTDMLTSGDSRSASEAIRGDLLALPDGSEGLGDYYVITLAYKLDAAHKSGKLDSGSIRRLAMDVRKDFKARLDTVDRQAYRPHNEVAAATLDNLSAFEDFLLPSDWRRYQVRSAPNPLGATAPNSQGYQLRQASSSWAMHWQEARHRPENVAPVLANIFRDDPAQANMIVGQMLATVGLAPGHAVQVTKLFVADFDVGELSRLWPSSREAMMEVAQRAEDVETYNKLQEVDSLVDHGYRGLPNPHLDAQAVEAATEYLQRLGTTPDKPLELGALRDHVVVLSAAHRSEDALRLLEVASQRIAAGGTQNAISAVLQMNDVDPVMGGALSAMIVGELGRKDKDHTKAFLLGVSPVGGQMLESSRDYYSGFATVAAARPNTVHHLYLAAMHKIDETELILTYGAQLLTAPNLSAQEKEALMPRFVQALSTIYNDHDAAEAGYFVFVSSLGAFIAPESVALGAVAIGVGGHVSDVSGDNAKAAEEKATSTVLGPLAAHDPELAAKFVILSLDTARSAGDRRLLGNIAKSIGATGVADGGDDFAVALFTGQGPDGKTPRLNIVADSLLSGDGFGEGARALSSLVMSAYPSLSDAQKATVRAELVARLNTQDAPAAQLAEAFLDSPRFSALASKHQDLQEALATGLATKERLENESVAP